MKKNIITILAGLFFCGLKLNAQNDSIHYLNEVRLSDVKLHDYSKGNLVTTLPDSILKVSQPSLTELLRLNSTIYLKENGIGGTSTTSFRGTNASHTAVVWNGLNINSQLNGQTDFNTISIRNYDNIVIRSGGGGVAYGSGAIGGSIHLNSEFKFKKHFKQDLITSIGSFRTTSTNYKIRYGTNKLYASLGVDHIDSKNNHKYLGRRAKGKKNENGEFSNYNFNLNLGYSINSSNVLKFFQNTYTGKRNFSGSLFSPSNDSYRDNNTRSMVQWNYFRNNFTSVLSLAYLYEKYRFFPNKEELDDFSFGKSTNLIFKYDVNYKFSNDIQLKSVFQHEDIRGKGSDIISERRTRASIALLFSHQINKRLHYGLNIRQEINDSDNFSFKGFKDSVKETYSDVLSFNTTTNIENDDPFLFSIDLSYCFSKFYNLKFNASKNFRTPTFNDLYWNGPGGIGNNLLQPEKSIQAEISNEFNYKGIDFGITGYFIKSKDLIVWEPISSTIWSPINVTKVYNYGLEAKLDYTYKWKKSAIILASNYSYTVSENQETKKQLIFVPLQSITSNLVFRYKKMNAFYQFRWNDDLFVTRDHSQKLKANDVANVGVNYDLYAYKNTNYNLGLVANNIYNEVYQLTVGRPAPNRNYQIRLILKF